MTKRYKTMQKKLREFESSLSHLFSLNPAAVPSPLLSELSAQQLVFLKKLLAAEISSHPSKPRHLAHISRHLNRLDSAFQHYRDHQDHDLNDPAIDGLEAASTCSCTESCLNDDGEGETDIGSDLCEDSDMFYEVAAAEEEEEKAAVVLSRVESMTEKEGVEMGKEGDWICVYLGVLGCGVVIGAVVMGFVMARFSGCFQCIQHEGFLIPT